MESETSSALFLPVRFRDRLFGVALLLSPLRNAFPPERRERAALAADYLGAALENALLHARTRDAERGLRSIFEIAMEGIYQCTSEGRLLAANTALARIMGHESERVLLATPANFPGRLHADADRLETFLRELRENDFVRGFEYEVRRADGQRAWVSESARALRDAGGALVAWEGVVEDVSRRKELEQQLQQAQKMEAVGRLAGGVAHDFNNLLTAILGYSGILLDRLAPTDPCRHDVGEIREAGRRAAALTGQLLAFSRKQVLQPVVLDLNDVVANIDGMLRRLIGEDIDLVTRAAPGPVHVQADPGQLDQVLVNLAVNGRDAMPGGGRLAIEVGTLDVDGAGQGAPLGLASGRYALLTVADTGIGMDDRVRSHLFEPFFTTKGPGKGTGLGLAVVYGIVKQSGGHIWCESTPGQGTCMRVCLPRVAAADPASLRPDPGQRVPRGSETVLVAEDEAAVRGLVRVVLETAGYRVMEARDGLEALEIASRRDGALHLLLSDIVMPGMNGRELACTLRRTQPSVRVLFTSGYTDSLIIDSGNLGPGTSFLQKPFSPAALLTAVRDLLDLPIP
jgi:PAS domain S-box-containing protein